jgi:hypothetical protein
MTNVMHKFFIYPSIHFCLTCFGLSFSPSSEAGVQFRLWFKSPGYGVSARALTPYPGLLLISAGAIEGPFEGKTPRAGRLPRGFCSWTTMLRLTGQLQPKRNGHTWPSNVITHPYLRIWPRRSTTCSLDWKNYWKVAIFRPTRRSLLTRRSGWTDNNLNFFEWLAKVRATG